jgi:hypothetical protein
MRLRSRPTRALRRLRPRSRAQAFVEFALAAPFVLLLVAGSAQVGAVAYGMVSTDTAAREGARFGAQHPLTSLTSVATSGGTYVCDYAVDNESVPTGNPICQAVYRSHGLLNPGDLTITITTNLSLSSLATMGDVVRVAASPTPRPTPTPLPCGSDAEVDGTVGMSGGGAPSQPVVVFTTGQGTVPSTTVPAGSTAYRLCLAVNSRTQTINALIGSGCGGYSGQATVNIALNNRTYTPSPDPILLTANACPTPTPTATPTPTPTPTATPAPTPTPVPTESPPPPFVCDNSAASATGFFSVRVAYPVPIFVPLVGNMIGDPGSSAKRTVYATVVQRIEPCTITGTE